MIITKPVLKRITNKVNDIAANEHTSIDKLVREIKSYLLQAVTAKGIPVDIAEEVAARLIVVVSMANLVTISK